VLFCRVADTRLRSLPCAVTGVNVHINYDLPFALVATWERLGHAPDGSRQQHDYLLVNEAFEQEIPGQLRHPDHPGRQCPAVPALRLPSMRFGPVWDVLREPYALHHCR